MPHRRRIGWEYQRFASGKEAATVLGLQHADPNTVYAYMLDRKDILVWWRTAAGEYAYDYKYIPWNSDQIPSLLVTGITTAPVRRIPIGIGSVNGKAAFVYFEAKRL